MQSSDPAAVSAQPLSLSELAAVGPLPPLPPDAWEGQRHLHTRKRRRLLDGSWRDDLRQAIRARVGTTRADAWSDAPILESNAFAAICRELAVLYNEAPVLRCTGAEAEAPVVLAELLRRSGVWGLMQRVQRYTLGLREMFVRVDVEKGRLCFRPVYPDLVWADPREDRPDQPVTVRELRLREFKGKRVWTWDVLSVADEDRPVYEIREALDNGKPGQDLTGQWHTEERSGDRYPYRRADGTPILPYVLYHAEQTGDRLWDPYTWAELVDSTIGLSVKYNMLDHTFMSASWPQRYVVGAAMLESTGSLLSTSRPRVRCTIPGWP